MLPFLRKFPICIKYQAISKACEWVEWGASRVQFIFPRPWEGSLLVPVTQQRDLKQITLYLSFHLWIPCYY